MLHHVAISCNICRYKVKLSQHIKYSGLTCSGVYLPIILYFKLKNFILEDHTKKNQLGVRRPEIIFDDYKIWISIYVSMYIKL